MQTENRRIFRPADILLPREELLQKWSVVACDQYTSQPEYWEDVARFVGRTPSALHMIFPEIYLEQPDKEARIHSINSAMASYIDGNIFRRIDNSYIYLKRILASGKLRRGIVGMIDLQAYDYHAGSSSPIRATEGTIIERIPPRVAIRRNAPLELPHIMLLINDPKMKIIEPLENKKDSFDLLYDFPLMMGSGHSRGWRIGASAAGEMEQSLDAAFGGPCVASLQFAVGDGNHSLATARECYLQLRQTLPPDVWERHPARFALVEVVNLHDPSLEFEPIHRVLFDVDPENLIASFEAYAAQEREKPCIPQGVTLLSKGIRKEVKIQYPPSNLEAGSVQQFLDSYLERNGGQVDYIHGEDVMEALCGQRTGAVGFLLPPINKSSLFPAVERDGALPRKTFSMGHACDKRFYLECRAIKE